MNEKSKVDRRKFLSTGVAGAGLLLAGGAAGWFIGGNRRRPAPGNAALDDRFTYDVSAFENTDPALLLYDESRAIPTGFTDPKCLVVGSDDSIVVGGDTTIKVLEPSGTPRFTVTLSGKPTAVCPADDGRLYVALKDHVEIYDRAGNLLVKWDAPSPKAYLTAIAATGDAVFVADAGAREVVRCDTAGRVLSRFGRVGAKDGNPGFVVPSPYFDLMVGRDGLLWVANPGRHRVEAYTLGGNIEFSWGSTGMNIDAFCGCCNPVYFSRLVDGRFVTSEKGLNRIKIYDPRGKFTGVVAGPKQLVQDLELAKKACANCQIGFGFDIACDSQGRVLALDPATRTIRIFSPKTQA